MDNVRCPQCGYWGTALREGHIICRECEMARERDASLGRVEFTGMFGKVDEFLAELVLGPDDIAVPETTSVSSLIKLAEEHFTKATLDRMRAMRWKDR